MKQYDKIVLSALLDSYERSGLFTGENKINRHIAFAFTRKNMPDYFNESSIAYEDIHIAMKELVRLKLIEIVWKRGRENHIIDKVLLNMDELPQAYVYLGRTPKAALLAENKELLVQQKEKYADCPVCQMFLEKLMVRLENNQSVREYIDLSKQENTEKLVKCIAMIEQNALACFYREFSIRYFADSKYFESILGTVGKIFREFVPVFQDMDIRDILAEYQIYHTPGYVYFKGEGIIKCGETVLKLKDFVQGIGLAETSLSELSVADSSQIRRVITIENLTTFTGWQEKDALLIYLGGYHNAIRRKLLQIIYQAIPDAKYLHFGDIDCGGFAIYYHLREKTGIPFEPYHMDCETLNRYRIYAKPLTENDRKRLKKLMEKQHEYETAVSCIEVCKMMLAENIKLEQEAVEILGN